MRERLRDREGWVTNINRRRDRRKNFDAGFEIIRAVIMKSSITWDMAPCSPFKEN
jgi:hypothetical protein